MAVLAGGCMPTHARAQPMPGEWSPDKLRTDIRQLQQHIRQVDRSFAAPARAEALARLERLYSAADTIRPVRFELELATVMALADNGHTIMPAVGRSTRYNRVPVRLVPFGTDFFVLRAGHEHGELLGARLESIDGVSVTVLRQLAHTLSGGSPAWRDRWVPNLLESPEQLHALGAIPRADRAEFQWILTSGLRVTQELSATSAHESPGPHVGSVRWLLPGVHVDGAGWLTLQPQDTPWSLRAPEALFRFRRMAEISAATIELRQNVSRPSSVLVQFLRSMRDSLAVTSPQHVILDLRLNGGGDLNLTRDFVLSLPQLVPGRVFVLTSPNTFSAAISTVGYLKQAAPDRVSIVGEEVGDRLEFWAEGRVLQLTGTGLRVGTATERHDYANGCRQYRDCHGAVVRHPIRLATLAPDISAPWTIAAYREGRDPGMEAIAEALKVARP